MKRAIRMHPHDNVVTALASLSAGEKVQVVSAAQEPLQILEANKEIPFGHKIALTKINPGDHILKYGEIIGIADQMIQPGDHVHIHNVESTRLQIPKEVKEREG
jgi:altronate dehydratase